MSPIVPPKPPFGDMESSRYVLDKLIGAGGMAHIWSGWRILPDGVRQRIAIKRMPKRLLDNPKALARFNHEASLYLTLSHENIVRIFDYIEKDGELWIIMERIDGLTVGELAEHRPLPDTVLRTILGGMVDALTYIHQRNILHRDISHNNVMITRDGTVKLLDFGLARSPGSQISTEGYFKGTPPFASHEALLGKKLDETSDLYSVGAVMFFLMTGTAPFGIGNTREIARRQRKNERVPWPPAMAEDLKKIVDALLRVREKRPLHSVSELTVVMHELWMRGETTFAEEGEVAEFVNMVMQARGLNGSRAGSDSFRLTLRASQAANDPVAQQSKEAIDENEESDSPVDLVAGQSVSTDSNVVTECEGHEQEQIPAAQQSRRTWPLVAAMALLMCIVGTCLFYGADKTRHPWDLYTEQSR